MIKGRLLWLSMAFNPRMKIAHSRTENTLWHIVRRYVPYVDERKLSSAHAQVSYDSRHTSRGWQLSFPAADGVDGCLDIVLCRLHYSVPYQRMAICISFEYTLLSR